MMKFLNALIDAEGIQLDSTPHANGRGGTRYRISVQSNGNLLIGSAYKTNGFDGDEFEITLGRKHISSKQLDETRRQLVAS